MYKFKNYNIEIVTLILGGRFRDLNDANITQSHINAAELVWCI
jgi:hypothetical protein